MKLSDFKYPLSERLIAQYPAKKRDKSRLMVLNRADQTIEERVFSDIVDYIDAKDCLVINETKVFPARLMGTKDKTDAKVEIFLLRQLENGLWEVLVKPARNRVNLSSFILGLSFLRPKMSSNFLIKGIGK